MNTTLTFVDKITHKKIHYNASDLFTIKTKSSYNRYIVRKVFKGSDIAQAVNEFYSIIVPQGHYKYLFRHPDGRHHQKGDLILRMRGEAEILPEKNLKLKQLKDTHRYETVAIANLYNCPKSLYEKFLSVDKDNFPASVTKWSTQKILFCLLSTFVELPPEEIHSLLAKSEELYIKHKIKSGHDVSRDIRVDVVVNEELL